MRKTTPRPPPPRRSNKRWAQTYGSRDGEGRLRRDEGDGGLLGGRVTDDLAADSAQVREHHFVRAVLDHRRS